MNVRERITESVLSSVVPSTWMKDVLIGGVGLLAIRISYVYLKAFASRPDLLAKLGPGLILGILGISIAGVLVNQLVGALGHGITRMADSAERSADYQKDSAASGQQLASAYTSMASAMQEIAGKDSRREQENEVALTTLVMDVRRVSQRLHGQDRALERIEDKLGINSGDVRQEGEQDDDA